MFVSLVYSFIKSYPASVSLKPPVSLLLVFATIKEGTLLCSLRLHFFCLLVLKNFSVCFFPIHSSVTVSPLCQFYYCKFICVNISFNLLAKLCACPVGKTCFLYLGQG